MGDQLSGAVARAEMLDQDNNILDTFREHKVTKYAYRRYVDDQLGAYKAFRQGMYWDNTSKSIEFSQAQYETDEGVERDVRTMKIIREMVNSINPRFQMTSDCPSANTNKMMPVLAIQVYVDSQGLISWEPYRKPMSNPLLVISCSALSSKVKRTTHVQEGTRILRSCNRTLPWEKKASYLTEFARRLQASGYPEAYREEIILATIRTYRKMEDREDRGIRPINRPDSFEEDARAKAKLMTKSTWFRKGNKRTVLFVPSTPDSRLATIIKATLDRKSQGVDWGVRIVEQGGRSLASMLETKYPVKLGPCRSHDCLPCKSGHYGVCRHTNVCYRITCSCGARIQQEEITPVDGPSQGPPGDQGPSQEHQYLGETSRNLASRSAEHLQLFRAQSKDSPLWKHCLQEHQGSKEDCDFQMELVARFRDPLTRLIYEGVLIKWAQREKGTLMNSRSEWSQPKVARVQLVRELGDPIPPRDPQHHTQRPLQPARDPQPARDLDQDSQTQGRLAPIAEEPVTRPRRGRPPKARTQGSMGTRPVMATPTPIAPTSQGSPPPPGIPQVPQPRGNGGAARGRGRPPTRRQPAASTVDPNWAPQQQQQQQLGPKAPRGRPSKATLAARASQMLQIQPVASQMHPQSIQPAASSTRSLRSRRPVDYSDDPDLPQV
jgi:hypothetical protein